MTDSIDRREFLISAGAFVTLAPATNSPDARGFEKLHVVNLRCNYVDRPLGLEDPRPRLSWQLQSTLRNVRQSFYRIRVASSSEALGKRQADLWDSGKVKSRKCFGICYQGRQLTSRQRCWWNVQVWDERGNESHLSELSWWEMGLLDPGDWQARWLAIENTTERKNREAKLNWIWGKSSEKDDTQKFRCTFELPRAASSGELIAVVNEWYWWIQITRIWLDGEPLAGPGTWVDMKTAREQKNHLGLSRQQLTLGALRVGRHTLAMEVSARDVWNILGTERMPDISYVPGCAVLALFQLETGETIRIPSGTDWKTAGSTDSQWHKPAYDDSTWSNATEAPVGDYQPWPATPAMHLRKSFSLHKDVVQARLYVTALGAYEGRLNGKRVGDALLTPEPSQYAKRTLYQVYDVAHLLQAGENVIGLTIADGWYASFDGRFAWAPPPRRVLAQLEITFADGSHQTHATGPGWRLAQSGLRTSEIKVGEVYDARYEQPAWDKLGFDDTDWLPAQVAESPTCGLTAQVSPAIRALQTIAPRQISQPKPGIYLIDFGLLFTGWCQLQVMGSRGSRVKVEYAELLTPSGEILTSNMHDPMGEPKRDEFVLKGGPGGETLAPQFAYRGFRYAQISGLEAAPTVDSVKGVFIHSDLRITGRFRSSTPILNELARSVLQTQRSNFTGIPTDNAVREFRGWMGDAAIFWDAASFNMDVAAYTSRHMNNAVDDQSDQGAFPNIAPIPRYGNTFHHAGTAPGWGDASIILPWTNWQRYGDTAIIEKHWEAMNRYVNFIQERNPTFIWKNDRSHDYGDSLAIDSTTPKDLVATAYWAQSVDLLAQMSEAIGRTVDAGRLRQLFDKIRRAFNDTFVKSDGTVGTGSQTSYVLPLRFKLLGDPIRLEAANNLAANITARGNMLTTGILGTQFILDVLADTGHANLAYDLLLRPDYPSWAHMILSGASTIWETWNGEGARNQAPLASVGGFLFRRVAGIDAATPGFERVVIRPVLDPRVTRSGADYESQMGLISIDWQQARDGTASFTVIIPPNVDARVHLPVSPGQRVTEERRSIVRHPDLRVLTQSGREVVIEVGSGTYQFAVS